MSDQPQADSVLQSMSCCYTEINVIVVQKKKLQNVGAGDPPSTILIHGVPVEEVDEFITLAVSRVLMATADRSSTVCCSQQFVNFYAGLDLPV